MLVDEKTIELFHIGELVFSIEERIDKALAAIVDLFMQARPVCISYSGGKDSSVVAALALHAATVAKERGAVPFVVVTVSDTLVETRISFGRNAFQCRFARNGHCVVT